MENGINKIDIAKSVSSIWDSLNDEQRELFVDNIEISHYQRGAQLYKEGDTPTFLHYLLKGKVALYRKGIAGQQIIRMIEPGALFGYVAAFDGGNYRSTAVIGEDSDILTIPITLMFHFVWENSSFAMLFLKELSQMLGVSIERTINMTQKHIRGRLAEALLLMKRKYGVESDGRTLSVYLSRIDLAQMSNMTTSNAIRTLSAFAKEGLIEIDGRKIKFVDIDELQRISDRG